MILSGGFLLAAMLAAVAPARESPAAPAPVQTPLQRIDARWVAGEAQIHGRATLRGVHSGATPLNEIVVFAYPNRFREPNPALDDANYFRHFPGDFNPGWMKVETADVRMDGHGSEKLKLLPVETGSLPPDTAYRIILPHPVNPGETFEVTLDFITRVPEMFGPFGHHGGSVYIKGGWHPYLPARDSQGRWQLDVPPPVSDWEIRFSDPSGLSWLVGGEGPQAEGEWTWAGQGLRSVSLNAGPQWASCEQAAGPFHLRYLQREEDPDHRGLILEIASDALEFLGRTYAQYWDPHSPLTVIEQPLREELSMSGDREGWLSERAMEVFPIGYTKNFHRVAAVRALFEQAFKRRIANYEHPEDWDWLAEGLASHATKAWLAEKAEQSPDARDMLSWFKFVPQIDQLIYAPKVPFVYAFFETVYETDSFRETLERFNNAAPGGKTVLERIRDFAGEDLYAFIMASYLHWGRAPFSDLSLAIMANWQSPREPTRPEELERFWAQILERRPNVNYRFEQVVCHDEGGQPVTEVTISREGDAVDFYEPVELKLWDADDTEHRVVIREPGWSRHVERVEGYCAEAVLVDPGRRLHEHIEGSNDDLYFDNASEHKIKILVENILNFALDISGDDVISSVGIVGRRERDLKNAARIRLFLDQQSDGVSGSYLRSFGPKVDANKLQDTLEFGYLFEQLDSSFRQATGENKNTSQSLFAAYTRNPTFFDLYPTREMIIRARTEHAGNYMGSDLEFHIYRAEFIFFQSILDTLIFSSRIQTGHLDGTVPSQKLFSAGGRAQMRGFEIDDFLGRDQLIFSGELQRMFVSDLNWNVLEFMRVTGWQGVVFADTGRVADGYSKLFRANRFLGDVGLGIRMFVEYAGIRPAFIGFDVAWRIKGDSPLHDLDAPRFYLAFDPSYYFFD